MLQPTTFNNPVFPGITVGFSSHEIWFQPHLMKQQPQLSSRRDVLRVLVMPAKLSLLSTSSA